MKYLIKFLNYIHDNPDPALGIIVIVGICLCSFLYTISMPTLCSIVGACMVMLVLFGIAGFD